MLTGCYDKIELEERGFVGAFSIDAEDGGVALCVELLAIGEDDGDNEKKDVRSITRQNLSSAMYELNEVNPRALSFALSKACLLGEELLQDASKLREVIGALDQNNEISGKLLIAAVHGEAADALSEVLKDESSFGAYISNHYKHARKQAGSALQLELEMLAVALHEDEGVLIPLISYDENNKSLIFSGAALVKGELAGFASNEELEGLAWAKGLGRGRLLSVKLDDAHTTLRITDQNTRYRIREDSQGIVCSISVRTKGHLEEYPQDLYENDEQSAYLERIFAEAIVNEIKSTYALLASYDIDGYGLSERLKKHDTELYERYGGQESYKLEITAYVKINN